MSQDQPHVPNDPAVDPATVGIPMPNVTHAASGKQMLPRWRELYQWSKKWGLEDSWWISAHGNVYGPFGIMEVDRRCNLLPDRKLFVLHASYASSNELNWIEMEGTPKETKPVARVNLSEFKITSKIKVGGAGDYQKKG